MNQFDISVKSDAQLARYGKYLTLIIAVIGIMFALKQSPVIFWFVIFAYNGLGSAFGPPLIWVSALPTDSN